MVPRADTPLTERIFFFFQGIFFFTRRSLTREETSLDYFPAVSNVNFKRLDMQSVVKNARSILDGTCM